MRKLLETITLAALGYLCVVTGFALYGPNPLPDRVPIHFDLAGHPDGWGPSSDLALFPFVAFVLYMLLTIVAHYPSLAPYPARVTAEGRKRLESLAAGMIAWIKAEMIGIFVCVQMTSIQAARHPDRLASLVGVWILLGAVFVTIAGYVAAMVRANLSRREPADSKKILPQP